MVDAAWNEWYSRGRDTVDDDRCPNFLFRLSGVQVVSTLPEDEHTALVCNTNFDGIPRA